MMATQTVKNVHFTPTENELFEYFCKNVVKRRSDRKHFEWWVQKQMESLIHFAIDCNFDLIMLGEKTKAAYPEFNHSPLTLEQALDWYHAGGWFGVRGNMVDILLDYDSLDLTPELSWLMSQTLTIMTPHGLSFVVMEPFDLGLWAQMEQRFPGFAPSPATVQARSRIEEVIQTRAKEGLPDVPVDHFFAGNARMNRSYVVYAGGQTCSGQSSATGIAKPPDIQHFGFGHSKPEEPCNGRSDGKHEYQYRLFYRPDGNYSSWLPQKAQILSFKVFCEIALGIRSLP